MAHYCLWELESGQTPPDQNEHQLEIDGMNAWFVCCSPTAATS
jgi:hypothetical protein